MSQNSISAAKAPSAAKALSAAKSAPAPLSVHLVLLLTQIAFGSLAVEGKLAMSPRFGIAPEALAMARIIGGAAVFVGANLAMDVPRVRRLKDMATLAGLSFFGIILNQVLFLFGLRQTSPVSATLLVATIPVFTVLIAALTRRDRLTARRTLGIAVALFGVAALSGFSLPHRGDTFVLFNALSYAIYVVFAKPLLERYGTLTVVAWIFGAGALLFAPVGAVALARQVPTWSTGAWGMVAFIVLVPTVLGYGANAWALRRASPTLVTIYVYLQPLVVVLLAWIQLDQALDARTIMAGLLILGGVTIVATAPRHA